MRLAIFVVFAVLPASASFFDHFTGTTLNSRWATAGSGQGVGCVNGTKIFGGTNSCAGSSTGETFLETVGTAVGDAGFIYYNTKIDKTKSQLWLFAMNRINASSGGAVWIVNKSTAPTADTFDNWDNLAGSLGRIRFGPANSATSFRVDKWDSLHVRLNWSSGTNAWVPGTSETIATIRTASYHIYGLEIDGPGAQWRALFFTQEGTGFGAQTQGYNLKGITDWVAWSTMETTTDLWMTIGKPYTDTFGNLNDMAEWVYHADGAQQYALANGHAGTSPYSIRLYWGYVGPNGVVDIWLPQDRTTKAIDVAATTWESADVKDASLVLGSNGTYYAAYNGSSGAGTYQIGIASASTITGTWTKASNPRISRSAATNEDQVFFPHLFEDLNEPDSTKRWTVIYTGETTGSVARLYRRTCAGPPTTCTWSASTEILAPGPGALTIAANDCARTSNVITCTKSNSMVVGTPVFMTGSLACPTSTPGGWFTLTVAGASTFAFAHSGADGNCTGTGTARSYDEDGAYRSRYQRVAGLGLLYWNAKNNTATGGPTRITYADNTNGDLVTWSKAALISVDVLGSNCNSNLTANTTASRIVTVASTTGCAADQMVMFDQDTTAANGFVGRIQKVDSATQVTLYTKLDGLTTTTPAKMRGADAFVRAEQNSLVQIDARNWAMWATVFHAYGDVSATYEFSSEVVHKFTASDPRGPWTRDELWSPAIPRDGGLYIGSAENIAILRDAQPAQPVALRRR